MNNTDSGAPVPSKKCARVVCQKPDCHPYYRGFCSLNCADLHEYETEIADLRAVIADLESEVARLRDDNHALQAEVILTIDQMEQMRSAIKTHREDLLRGGPECGLDVTPFDRNLWAVLDA